MATTEPQATGVEPETLQQPLDGRYADLRRQIRDVLSRPEFAPPIAIPTAEVNRLCDEVRADAEALVDAFGIPDQVLRAPIGLRNPSA